MEKYRGLILFLVVSFLSIAVPVMAQEEVVIKSLGNYLGSLEGLAGATIMGDGRVALILDVERLITSYHRLSAAEAHQTGQRLAVANGADA